jgi:hypothetical protein
MNALEDTLVEVASRLDELDVSYAVVGGMANAIWGEPRSTVDVDVTVWVEEPALASFVHSLGTRFRFCAADPLAFAHETRVVPVESATGVRIDFILGLLPFEKEAIDRAVTVRVAECPVRFVTAEDLILMKVVSERQRDIEDARGVALRRMAELDLAYLEPRIEELARLLERPQITQRWQAWKSARPQHT